MPVIRPISGLHNKTPEISKLCHDSGEPVFITKNGESELVVMSAAAYERDQARLKLYELLSTAAPRPPGCFPEATWDRRRRPSPPLFAGSGRRWKRNLLGLQNCATRIKS